MTNSELFAVMTFVSLFCDCCQKKGMSQIEPCLEVARRMELLIHRASMGEEKFRQAASAADQEQVRLILRLAKCLLDNFAEMERQPDYDDIFGTGLLNKALSDQLADVITTLRDYLDK